MLAWLHMQRAEYQQGATVMNGIPTSFDLSGDESAEYQDMTVVFGLLKNLCENGYSTNELTQAQRSQLQGIVAGGTGFAKVYARNILVALGVLEYEEPVILPDLFKTSEAVEAYEELLNTPAPKMLEVYPNPSKDFVILGYRFDKETHGMIEIRDVSGRLMESIAFNGMQDQVTLTTRGWTPGVYVLSLVVKDKVIESTKFTLVN